MRLPVKCILLNYICAYIAVQVLFLMRTQALSLHVLLVGKKHIILNTYYCGNSVASIETLCILKPCYLCFCHLLEIKLLFLAWC